MSRKIKRMHMKNMIYRIVAYIFFLSLFCAAIAEERLHVLQKGETLYGISRKYNVPADAILKLNDISDPDKLRVGQKIKIPDLYVVIKGDSLYGISRKLLVPIDTLIAANNLLKDATLKAGTTLYVPSLKSTTDRSPSPAPVSDIIPQKPFEDPRSYEIKKVDSRIIWPVEVQNISYLTGKIYGVSITSDMGGKVKSISSGTVISSGPYRGFGHVVFLQSKAGFIYVYGGLGEVRVQVGDVLSFGDELGFLGSDSLSGKPQLYFMVYNKDIPVDPAKAPRGY